MASTSDNRAASQETLVDDSQFQFRFSDDNPVNTTIRGPDGRVLYRVTTSFADGTVTVIESATGAMIASLRWSEMGSDKISVGADKPVRMGKLLHSSPLLLSGTVSFKDQAEREYQWKGKQLGSTLRLYAKDSAESPIAAYHRSRPNPETGTRSQAYLTILPRGQEILDMVVWTYCFLEKQKRNGDSGFGTAYGRASNQQFQAS